MKINFNPLEAMLMKFNRLFFLTLMGMFSLVLAACSNNDDSTSNQHNFPSSDMSEYGIDSDHHFYDITMYEALQLRDDESFNGILYFGFPVCPWCQVAIPAIHEASQETGTDIFYVSRRHDLREGEWLEWDEEMAWWLDEQIEMRWHDFSVDGGIYRPNIFVPQIIHLRDGVVIDEHEGTFAGHDPIDDELPDLTDEEYATLLETYIRIFSGVHMCDIDDDNCS